MASDIGTKAVNGKAFSFLAACAIAFGCATGWGSFIMPGTMFLQKAGPVGTVVGLLLGGAIMAVVGWNFARMLARQPGPGGAYAYVRETFGIDHGFLCAWFLSLTYAAIIWANATALSLVTRALFGNLLAFGPHYALAGYEVYLGDLLLSTAAIALAAALCLRAHVAARVQSTFAIVFTAGVTLVFVAALARRACGGAPPLPEPFSATNHEGPVAQTLRIVALAPWLYVGFEAVSHISGELRFPLRRAFTAMVVGLGVSVVVYAMLTLLPALLPADGPVPPLGEDTLPVPTFRSAAAALGAAGAAALGAAAAGAIFPNLVGNTLVTSRLLATMARDGILPAAFGAEAKDGSPRRAILTLAAVSALVPLLGRTAIGFIVDVSTVGAAIAYAYVSAAAWRTARAEGGRLRDKAIGLAGLVLSLAVVALFLLPNILADGAIMVTESYLILTVWCIVGICSFFAVFRRDRRNRFGSSPVAWFALLTMVLFLSFTWMRQSTNETTDRVFGEITRHHAETCVAATSGSDDWLATLNNGKDWLEDTVVRNSTLLTGTTVLSFFLLFGLHTVLRRREREAEREKTRAKSYFFSTVSHDIRTPLNAIIGYSEMLKAGISDEADRTKALDAIIVSGKTLLGLVNDVLDLSKLENGKMEILPEPTDCLRLLSKLADAFRATITKPDVELRCRLGEMPPLMLDPQRLRQVVFNLVGNAVKFTEHGHVEIRAAWEPGPGGAEGTFRLDVEDTGCGIGEADIERILSAYVQVGSKTARNGGTGLGLAICKELAAAMGGRLEVASEPGRGSTFSLVLSGVQPASPAAAAAKSDGAQDERAEEKPAAPIRRILLVDDVPVNVMVLKAQLERLGSFRIETASDGEAALALLERRDIPPFDIVLTDMWMPKIDGAELVRAVRSRPRIADLRIVAVTADVEMQGKYGAMGFDGILLKPVTAAKLSSLIPKP